MVKLLKQEFDIFALRNTRGSTVGLQKRAHNEANPANDINKYQAWTERVNIFLKPKDDRNVWRAGG